MTSLLAFDKEHNFQFQGLCKVVINRLQSILFIEPKNEAFKLISASFKWTFVSKKNFLFVFADYNFLDFCLVFRNEKLCQKVFNYIPQEVVIPEIDNENMIKDRFLLPMFQKIYENPDVHFELIKLIAAWISLFNEESKEKFSNLMKECNVYEIICAALKSMRMKETPFKLQNLLSRKRKIEEICKHHAGLVLPELSSYTKVYPHSQIQLGYIGQKGGARQKLLIFTSAERKSFHLFTYISQRNVYACPKCKWQNTAIVDVENDGNICAKLTTKDHLCPPQSVIPESFIPSKIIRKPDYEIYEGGGYNRKTLIIFDSFDKELCYEYCGRKSTFYCLGCVGMKNTNRKNAVKVYFEGSEKEYAEIIRNDHICKIRKYEPEKYQKVYEFVLKPNFEVQRYIKHGTEKKKLIIFDKNDRNFCYSYYYDSNRSFVCHECSKEGKNVTAKLRQNSDGEKYIILSMAKHICKLKPYVPFKDEVTIHPPEIELMKETKNGLPKLFVFVGEDRKKCYIFTTFRHTLKLQKYFCTGCRVKIDNRKSERNKFGEMVSGYLDPAENGGYCLKLPTNYKHICSPKNFQPEEFQNSPKSYDFFFFREKKGRGNPQLAMYHFDDKKLCYHFRFKKYSSYFICKRCEKEKKNFTMPLHLDESGKAFFYHDSRKHICKPLKVSSILGPKVMKLKDDAINYHDYIKSKPKQPKKEEKIVKFPNFEFCTSKNGVPDGKLIIFHTNDKELCYEYTINYTIKGYMCYKCEKKGKYVIARLKTGENGEKYIVLGNNDHICEPIKYHQRPNQIIKEPNFVIVNKDDETKPTKIIIFTNSSKNLCYEYSFFKSSKKYGCSGCNNMGKNIYLKLIKNENGEECIELRNSAHICQPRKYEPEKYDQIIIPETRFKLCKNTKDEENKKVLLFTSEAKNMAFSYYWSSKNYYICLKCKNQGGKVPAVKLCENENGENFLEHNKNEHICLPEKVNLDELDTVIIEESMFEFHYGTLTDEANRRLIIFTSEEKESIYVYNWCQKNSYRCYKCKRLDKLVLAKVYEDESGGKYLELNGAKHECAPEKFIREKYPIHKSIPDIFQESQFELSENSKGEKDKRLIIFSSEDKKMGYIFTWAGSRSFRCNKCFEQKTNNVAKLQIDENGKRVILHDMKKHVCKPRPCQNVIIPESMFKIGPITNSTKNNGLIVFTSEKKDKVYEYTFCGRNYYKCRLCLIKNKTVSAHLLQNENGEKYLELNHAQHICKPKSL